MQREQSTRAAALVLVAVMAAALVVTAAPTTAGARTPARSTRPLAAAAPTPTPARTGVPTTMAVLGDSISAATGTGQLSAEMKQNSWATGSVAWSIRGQLGIATANAYNQASNGRRMGDMASQASSLPTSTRYVVVELGGNDLCRPSVAEMTPTATYRAQFRAGLAALRARVPDALIFVASIPDIYNLWFLRGAPESVNPYVSDQVDQAGRARFFWDNFLNIEVPCQSLLTNPTSLSAADVNRRNQVRERNLAFNAVLREECGAVLRCRYDDDLFFDFSSNRQNPPDGPLLPRNQWGFEDRDISHNRKSGSIDWSYLCPTNFTYDGCGDHFHPSLIGQQKLATAGMAASYQFATDATAPAVTLTPSRSPDGDGKYATAVDVAVTATDAAGVRGYEVRVHGPDGTIGPWVEHVGTAPTVTVSATGVSHVEARALDVNGNLSASRSLGVDVDPAAFGTLAGRVTTAAGSGAGAPVGGAWVLVLDRDDHSFAAAAVADADGRYELTLTSGDYEAMLVDPAGRHAAEWADDAPSQAEGDPIAVGGGATTTLDAALAPAGRTASISGAVTEDGSGDPVPGALAFAVSTGGVPTGGAVADAQGDYTIAGLPAGDYHVITFDPTGAHAVEFFDDATGFADGDPVTVAAGGTTVADVSLATRTPSSGTAALTGRVTDSASGQPVAGAVAVALRRADYAFTAAARTDATGSYAITLDPGDYRVEIVDPTFLHAMEWYDDLPYYDIAAAVPVTVSAGAPGVADAALDPTGPSAGIVGTVTHAGGGPFAGALVLAIGSDGAPVGGAVTAADGTYLIGGLTAGNHLLVFVDPTGAAAPEFHDGAAGPAGATLVTTTAGAVTTVDADLAATP